MEGDIGERIEALGSFIADQLSPNVIGEIIREALMKEVRIYLQGYLKAELENFVVQTVRREVEAVKQQCNLVLEQVNGKLQENLLALSRVNVGSLPMPPRVVDPQPAFFQANTQNILQNFKPEGNTPQGFNGQNLKPVDNQFSDEALQNLFANKRFTEGFQMFLSIQDERIKENYLSSVNLELINERNLDLPTADALAQWALTSCKTQLLARLITIINEAELLSRYLRRIVQLRNPVLNDIKSMILLKTL